MNPLLDVEVPRDGLLGMSTRVMIGVFCSASLGSSIGFEIILLDLGVGDLTNIAPSSIEASAATSPTPITALGAGRPEASNAAHAPKAAVSNAMAALKKALRALSDIGLSFF